MLTEIDKKNAIWNSASFIISSILSFVSFTLNTKSFSTDLFGLFILISSIFGIGSSLDFGFGVSTVKHIAEANKTNDKQLISSIYASFLIVFFSFSVMIAALFLLYYFIYFEQLSFLESYKSVINTIYFLLTITFIFKYMSIFYNRVFEGLGLFILLSKINISLSIINTISMLLIFLLRMDIVFLSLTYLMINFFAFCVLLFYSRSYFKFKLEFFDFKIIRKHFLYSFNLQLSFLVNSFIDPIIKLIVSKLLGLNFVTYFEISKKFIDLSNGLIQSIQKGIFNKISEANITGTLDTLINEHLYVNSKLSNIYSILLYGILNPFICFFVMFWFKSYESMIMLLIFFMPYSLINFATCLYQVIMVQGKGMKLLFIQTINVVLTSVFLYFSIFYSGNYIGLLGFYIATITNVILIFYFLVNSNGFQPYKYLKLTQFKDIILLSVMISSQIILLYYYREGYLIILVAFALSFMLVFYKYVKLFLRKFTNFFIYGNKINKQSF